MTWSKKKGESNKVSEARSSLRPPASTPPAVCGRKELSLGATKKRIPAWTPQKLPSYERVPRLKALYTALSKKDTTSL